VLGYADFRFADCGWRKAYPKLDAFHQKMLERPSVKNLGTATRVTSGNGDRGMREGGKLFRRLGLAALFHVRGIRCCRAGPTIGHRSA
jgi:hypothetical protein